MTMNVTREEIRAAFVCLLNREPESDVVYNVHATCENLIQLRQMITRGEEFRRRMAAIREAHHRDALFFIHLEKTGGSSVLAMLAAHYQPGQIAPSHYGFRDVFDPIESTYDFFAGHFDYNLVNLIPRRSKKIVSVFRRPIDRLISSYRFSRAHPAVPTDANQPTFLAKKLSPLDFFSHPSVRSSPTINNYYLRMFGSVLERPIPKTWSLNDDSDLLETAQSRIRSLDALGLTHRMAESVPLICSAVGIPVPDTLVLVNKTDDLPMEDPNFARVPPVVMSRELDDALHDLIHYDEVLFQTATREFERRLFGETDSTASG